MILQAAINGARRADEHVALPATPDEIVADVRAVVVAGANEIHLHLRGDDGLETLSPTVVDPLLGRVRAAVPGTLIGVSTGAWIERDDAKRLAHIRSWSMRPDYASVNLKEAGSQDVIDALLQAGIGVELGLFDEADVAQAVERDLIRHAFRILVEIDVAEPSAALALADRVLAKLSGKTAGKSILLHGMHEAMWPIFDHAVALGLSQRLGLEDGLKMPDSSPAPDNATIIVEARRRLARA